VRERWGLEGDLYQKQSPDRQVKINAKDWADNLLDVVQNWMYVVRRQEGQAPPKDEDRRVALKVVTACMELLPPQTPENAVGFEDQLSRIAAQLGGTEGNRLGVWLYGIGKYQLSLLSSPLACGTLFDLRCTFC
jgi:hypothetical protein